MAKCEILGKRLRQTHEMRMGRPDINLRTTLGYGKAAALLHAMFRQNVTLLLTTRCDLHCRHCYAPRPTPPQDMDPELVKDTVDELKHLPALYFSGGEPLLYRANEPQHEQLFLDLAHYTAERVGRFYIDTNGSFLPKDIEGARLRLTEFPEKHHFFTICRQATRRSFSKIG